MLGLMRRNGDAVQFEGIALSLFRNETKLDIFIFGRISNSTFELVSLSPRHESPFSSAFPDLLAGHFHSRPSSWIIGALIKLR